MGEERQCPMCHRTHAVAADGTIATWLVTWSGVGGISQREESFIHYEDAKSEYEWIKRDLELRATWQSQKAHLTLAEGERASWYELFESPDATWEA